MNVKIKKLHEDAELPVYKTTGSACADLTIPEDVIVQAGEKKVIPLGFSMQLPYGAQAKILPRSGLASRGHLVTIGVIDADYRGEVGVMFHNATNDAVQFLKGSRIAQMDIQPIYQAEFIESEELTETVRGTGGFGSTGV